MNKNEFIESLKELGITPTEEQLNKKIDTITEINNNYYELAGESHSCYYAWIRKTSRVTEEMKENILLFTNLFNLVRSSIGADKAKNDLDKEIERLQIKLDNIINSGIIID